METEPPDQSDDKILKPKRTRTMTEEAKKQYAERMRKVNEDRCEKARLQNEAILEAKEKEIQMRTQAKLEQVAKKKEQIKAAKEKRSLNEPTEPKAPEVTKEEPKAEPKHEVKPKGKKKQVVVYESSSSDQEDDDDDSSEEEEEEIIYVAKKPSKKIVKQTIVKPKKEKHVSLREPLEAPKTVIKFL